MCVYNYSNPIQCLTTLPPPLGDRDPPGAGPVAAPRDLLDVYLDAADDDDGGGGSSGGDGRLLSEASLLRNVFDVFLAGGDTTAMATCGTLYEVRGSIGHVYLCVWHCLIE